MTEKRIAYDTYIEHQPDCSFSYYAPEGYMDNWRCGASKQATLRGGTADGRTLEIANGGFAQKPLFRAAFLCRIGAGCDFLCRRPKD